ncbi:GDCCVxC domain-containing (seleno)protein [uncultured Meiothermus sp.]|uniref:GDCCVxC domain-containing (seleno)protein n=1 Tax=uncultured Meiothermus sp. TaxID=157471 RepID=UPI002603905E|nr:GDCCVxC domain-containing (seleno)protein [uncultured Meiothermus sp.]
MPILEATLTCPQCGGRTAATMPTDACQRLFACPCCGVILKPKPGDCCVFCSFADVPCPPKQEEP